MSARRESLTRCHPRAVVLLALAVVTAALAAAPAGAVAQAPAAPSLRLFAADRGVTLERRNARLAIDLGLWVAAVGGEFRLHVRRPDYREWQASQVDASSGRVLRSIPPRMLDGWNGLRDFLRVRIVNASSRVVGRVPADFCPAGFRERVDAQGPRRSRYDQIGCGSGFPFQRGVAWGIDAGWATAALVVEGVDLRPGRYTAIAEIRRPYRRLFAIPAADAVATVGLRITRASRGERRRAGGSGAPLEAPRPRAAVRALAQAGPEPDPAALPDLVALPAWDVKTRRRQRRDLLRFAASTWNAGPGPLIVEGFRRPGRRLMDARQFFQDPSGDVVGSAPAGSMAFERHGGHDHWHFLQFASYRLVDERDRTVVRGTKQSFCLFPTDAVDLTLPTAALGSADGSFNDGSLCGGPSSIWIRETLPVGWADTYGSSLSGQAFDITTVRNGRYYIEIHANAGNDLRETSTTNNVQRRRILLGGRRGARTVRVARWNGIRD